MELNLLQQYPARVVAGIILFVAALGIVGNADLQDQIDQQEWYCENVEIWVASNGRNGHPNYKGIDCEADL